jgi:hypothetical protein
MQVPRLIEGKRTFCKGFKRTPITGTEAVVEVDFTGTSGNLINCNYFKVNTIASELAGANGTTYSLICEPKKVSIAGRFDDTGVLPFSNIITSGICGVGTIGVARNNNSGHDIEWKASNGEVCNGLLIQILPNLVGTSKAEEILVMVEYGNIFAYNSIRTDSYDLGL